MDTSRSAAPKIKPAATSCRSLRAGERSRQNISLPHAALRLQKGNDAAAPRARHSVLAQAVVTDHKHLPTPDVADREQNGNGNGNGASSVELEEEPRLVFAPEEFLAEPGVPCVIQRDSPLHPSDQYHSQNGSKESQWWQSNAGYMREILNAKVYDVAVESPLELAHQLSAKCKNSIYLKREDNQKVFSFKLRGAYNKMASLSEEQRAKGVITSSAGNHAQGVALAAKALGCKAIVCMPIVAPDIKIQAVQRLGGTVELVGESYTETQTYAMEKSKREGMTFIAPYDDPYVIAGQGTIGAEILRQLSPIEKENLEAVFVAIGGGGLAAGIAIYIKALYPHVKVIGVEPSGANCMYISLSKGRRVTLSKVDAFADGVAVKTVGAETFRICRQFLDGVTLVDNQSISGAIEAVFNDKRSILEPAGAVAVAGAAQYLERHNLQGKTVVAITSGANMNFDRLRLVADLAAVGAGQEAVFVTTIPERLGSFQTFMDIALADSDTQITEFKYRYAAEENAHILWGANVKSHKAAQDLVDKLNAKGLPTRDTSGIEAVQVHLRHLVGGRARSYTGSLPHEHILQVDFPERQGALRNFLSVVAPTWNLTLFHYRKSGNRQTPLLLGIQIPPETEGKFLEAQEELGESFSFTYLTSSAREIFDMFVS